MRHRDKSTGLGLLALALLLPLLSACEREGPAERAGEQIDEAVEQIRDPDQGPAERTGERIDETIEKAKEETGEAIEQAGETLERTGERLDR